MLNDLQAPSVADGKIVYWHRELPPLDAEPLGEHTGSSLQPGERRLIAETGVRALAVVVPHPGAERPAALLGGGVEARRRPIRGAASG